MKIMIVCSKHHYHHIEKIKKELEKSKHIITLPNSFEDPMFELRLLEKNKKAHIKWIKKAWEESENKIKRNHALLVLNFDKEDKKNYIGGATFTEMFMAYRLNKKIFVYNPLPKCSFADELFGMNPTIINQNLSLIK